ncbi:MAG: HlyD family efflux transporter periplasmic adaptor subunit, partial [Anaerolineae bacterium]|nr:HlyD family efflux transporter periplasmic adaptor subunit [Anaerolineae bacterium]
NRADGDAKKAAALLAMTNAQLGLNSLQATYNWYTGTPSETDIAIVYAKLNAAEAAFQEAEWYLATLNGEKLPSEASGTKLTALQQAKDNLDIAENQLDQSRLIAPISGIIAELNIIEGEYAFPANILITISDMEKPQVKTTDLSERDITKVKVGALATIFVDALNEAFRGKVTTISPIADTLGGDVIYEITLTFDEPPADALSGMTAEVSIEE